MTDEEVAMGGTQAGPDSRDDRQKRLAQVVVLGAGPAGPLLAGDLAESGIDVPLLEKRAKADAQRARWASWTPVGWPTI